MKQLHRVVSHGRPDAGAPSVRMIAAESLGMGWQSHSSRQIEAAQRTSFLLFGCWHFSELVSRADDVGTRGVKRTLRAEQVKV